MTCIAWDGKTLAADKAATNCGYSSTVTKVYRVAGGRVGFSGEQNHSERLLAWFKGGRVPSEYPYVKDESDGSQALFVDDVRRELRLFAYGQPLGIKLEQPFTAMGSGRDYALAAMHLGKSAAEAVGVACAFDTGCGRGIDVLELPHV